MNDWREQLIAARIRRGLTVPAVAQALNVARGTVYRWEAGTRSPEWDVMQRWASVVGVDLALVVMDDSDERRSYRLIERLRQHIDSLDDRALRMLEAQVDVLTLDSVKKV